jgi:hypothetical protein
LTNITEEKIDPSFNVIGVGFLVCERIGEPIGRVDSLELTGDVEGIALRRLHLDPIGRADPRLELQPRDGEPRRTPPPC